MFQYKVVDKVLTDLRAKFPNSQVFWGQTNVVGFAANPQPRLTAITAYRGEDPQMDSGFIPQLMMSVDIEAPLNAVSEERLWREFVPGVTSVLQNNQFTITQAMPDLEMTEQDDIVTLRVVGTRPA